MIINHPSKANTLAAIINGTPKNTIPNGPLISNSGTKRRMPARLAAATIFASPTSVLSEILEKTKIETGSPMARQPVMETEMICLN